MIIIKVNDKTIVYNANIYNLTKTIRKTYPSVSI